MSTVDEQAKAASGNDSGHLPDRVEEKEQGGSNATIILFFILGFIASLVVGWVVFPQLLYSSRPQPVEFNHALHNEMVDEGCESCHFFREDGSYSGVPTLAQCIDCHEEVQGDSEAEEHFVTEYVQKEREVPWLVYSRQPPCVFFPHTAHVLKAGMECEYCHGPVGESESLRPYQQNRISRYSRDLWGHNIAGMTRNSWERMKMSTCSDCHRRENVNQSSVQTGRGGCFVCHK